MSSTLDPLIFALQKTRESSRSASSFALATITSTTGGLFVRFDGETAASPRSYKRLNTYTPVIGARVLLARVGSTWVVLGSIA